MTVTYITKYASENFFMTFILFQPVAILKCVPLQSDIIDVNTIFKDLATMVHEQGSMVDSIEQNVESTNIRVAEGTDQLRQAEAYKVG